MRESRSMKKISIRMGAEMQTFQHACKILVPTRDPTLTPAVGVQSFNHWTARELLQ